MNNIKEILHKKFARRMGALLILFTIMYLMRGFLSLFIFTFLFIYLIDGIQRYLNKKISKFIPANRIVITLFIYIVFLTSIVLLAYVYIPDIISQCVDITNSVTNYIINMDYKKSITDHRILTYIDSALSGIDVAGYLNNAGKILLDFVTNLGKLSFDIFMALILSMFFLLQKNKVILFVKKFGSSKIAWIYEEMKYFGSKFSNSFGKVIQTQIFIAFINAILSIIILWIMGFPKLLGFGAMIFLFGLVPVAGVVASLIPLSIIAFSIGGFTKVLYVLAMILILHGLESYILNPKLMSDKTKLPVFFTFFILIVSEHFLGIWGLIIGLPIVMFILDMLNVNVSE